MYWDFFGGPFQQPPLQNKDENKCTNESICMHKNVVVKDGQTTEIHIEISREK